MKMKYSGVFLVATWAICSSYGINHKLFELEAEGYRHSIFLEAPTSEDDLKRTQRLALLDDAEAEVLGADVSSKFEGIVLEATELLKRNFEVSSYFKEFTALCQGVFNSSDNIRKQFIICELLKRVTEKVRNTVDKVERWDRKRKEISSQKKQERPLTTPDTFSDIYESFFQDGRSVVVQ